MSILQTRLVLAEKRRAPYTSMHWIVYPESSLRLLQLNWDPGLEERMITGNNAAFANKQVDGQVHGQGCIDLRQR